MGMDSVELVMECEDEFEITISDEDASVVTTPGELTRLVLKLMRRNGKIEASSFCSSAKLFNRIRSRLVDLGFDRDQIKPDTKIGTILDTPAKVRQARYELSRFDHPKIGRTSGDQFFIWCVFPSVLVMGLLLGYFCFTHLNYFMAILCATPIFIGLLVIDVYCFARESVLLEPDLTLREVINGALDHCEEFSTVPEEAEVWFSVRMIVCEQLGLTIERVTPDASFIKDLGMD